MNIPYGRWILFNLDLANALWDMLYRERDKFEKCSDNELINIFKKKGDAEALAILYNRYIHLVYGVCLKYLRNKQDSEDATMQIFEKLILEVPKFEIKNFKSWLHVMSKNFCLMKLRTFKSSVEFEEAFISSANVEFDSKMHHEDEVSIEHNLSALEKCLKTLNEEQRKCIELFYLKEKSYREIVNIEGYDLKNVKSHIQNGKRNIKHCIEKEIGK